MWLTVLTTVGRLLGLSDLVAKWLAAREQRQQGAEDQQRRDLEVAHEEARDARAIHDQNNALHGAALDDELRKSFTDS